MELASAARMYVLFFQKENGYYGKVMNVYNCLSGEIVSALSARRWHIVDKFCTFCETLNVGFAWQ